jgi:hypothetical protein
MIEQLIVGATGLGYLVVGVLQWVKGEPSNGMIWTGYAFAQVGLWLNLNDCWSTKSLWKFLVKIFVVLLFVFCTAKQNETPVYKCVKWQRKAGDCINEALVLNLCGCRRLAERFVVTTAKQDYAK